MKKFIKVFYLVLLVTLGVALGAMTNVEKTAAQGFSWNPGMMEEKVEEKEQTEKVVPKTFSAPKKERENAKTDSGFTWTPPAPSKPVQPKPEKPSKPVQPKPEQPSKPVQPKPVQPKPEPKPVQPKPEQPSRPVQPEPVKPETPKVSVKPEQPKAVEVKEKENPKVSVKPSNPIRVKSKENPKASTKPVGKAETKKTKTKKNDVCEDTCVVTCDYAEELRIQAFEDGKTNGFLKGVIVGAGAGALIFLPIVMKKDCEDKEEEEE